MVSSSGYMVHGFESTGYMVSGVPGTGYIVSHPVVNSFTGDSSFLFHKPVIYHNIVIHS